MSKILQKLTLLAIMSAPWMVKAQTTVFTFSFSQPAELLADAGADQLICPGDSVTIGGAPTASGGTPTYGYTWTPSSGLTSTTVANPMSSPSATTNYTLTVSDGRNCTAMDDIEVAIDTCVGISELPGIATVTVFPNPNNGSFRVEAKMEKTIKVFKLSVLTLAGREVYARERRSPAAQLTEDVTLNNIAKGVYMVRMDFDGSVAERKIVIQ